MNHGLGSPTLFVYPPFSSYAYSLLQPLGRILRFNPFNAGEFLALLGSGICAFLWLQTAVSRSAALASAILYMLMPYHLAVDFYRRTALSECWAFVWMPLILYFATQVSLRKRFAIAAVAYALLILSHLVSVAIFSLIPLAATLTLSERGEKIPSALRVGAGMMLGVGLSSFYFLPALSHARYFPVNRLFGPGTSLPTSALITLDDLHPANSTGLFIVLVSLSMLTTVAFIIFCSLGTLSSHSHSKRQISFWLAVCIIPAGLMTSASRLVWTRFPELFYAIQFPWRLNMVLCLAALPVSALFFSEVPRFSRWLQITASGLILLVVLTWIVAYGKIWQRYLATDADLNRVASLKTSIHVSDDDGWFPSWSTPGLNETSALSASLGPQVRFAGVDGTTQVRRWKARHLEFQADSATGGWVVVKQFYYPEWTAATVDTTRPLALKATKPEGLIEIEVPPGHQEIRVDIPVSFVERLGRWVTAFSFFLLGILPWRSTLPASTSLSPLPQGG